MFLCTALASPETRTVFNTTHAATLAVNGKHLGN